jgi:alkylation response protein AidB-like acyl-CoA dehydrogenase
MDLATALTKAKEVASRVLAPNAAKNDKEGRFAKEAVEALGQAGLMGLLVPADCGGSGLGPRAFADVVAAISEADASTGMVYTMHCCATACIAAAPKSAEIDALLADIVKGTHLTTLAFSEAGSRSHFWAPVSKAQKSGGGFTITARKSFVTSAGHAQSYVVSTLAHDAKGPTDSTLYLVKQGARGFTASGAWDGMGLRANASGPMMLEAVEVGANARLTEEGTGFKAMLEIVLPLFNLGSAAVALGICRATVSATVSHLRTAKFEHLGATLGEALPTLRAQLADMQMATDGLAARLEDTVKNLEKPGDLTMLRVLEVKAAAAQTAVQVTSDAMNACGGAAFSKNVGVERYFRDARAGTVMSPTVDVLREFIGKAVLGIPLF